MERIRILDHHGAEIVYLDFTGLDDAAAATAVMDAARARVSAMPEKSALTLTDVTNATFDAKVAEALWKLLRANKPHVRAGAVVGIGTEEQRMLFDLVTHQSRRRMEVFDDIERAKDWLAEQGADAE
jgi:hypothetical protein